MAVFYTKWANLSVKVGDGKVVKFTGGKYETTDRAEIRTLKKLPCFGVEVWCDDDKGTDKANTTKDK